MLQKALDLVREFHIRNNYPCNMDLKRQKEKSTWKTDIVFALVNFLLSLSCSLMKNRAISDQNNGDVRLYRTWLMTEELYEVVISQQKGDEVLYADALGDLTYVVLGSAITDYIPLNEIFMEIHKTNMNKKKKVKEDIRMRDKGNEWKPPDIEAAIMVGRLLAEQRGN